MCAKMAISAYILKIFEKDPFLRLQMRAKEIFNRHHFLCPHMSHLIALKIDHRKWPKSASPENEIPSLSWYISKRFYLI